MVGSCLQPIKANKVISCGTQDSQHPIRTAATETCQSPLVPTAVHTNCEFSLRGFRNWRFSTFNQNSSNRERTTYDSAISTCIRPPCELQIFSSWHTELEIQFNSIQFNSSSSRHMYPLGTYFFILTNWGFNFLKPSRVFCVITSVLHVNSNMAEFFTCWLGSKHQE